MVLKKQEEHHNLVRDNINTQIKEPFLKQKGSFICKKINF